MRTETSYLSYHREIEQLFQRRKIIISGILIPINSKNFKRSFLSISFWIHNKEGFFVFHFGIHFSVDEHAVLLSIYSYIKGSSVR